MKPLELVEIYCKYCKEFLCDAIEGSDVRCPSCGRWTKVKKENSVGRKKFRK